MRELEDALRIAHAYRYNNDTHPLLTEELLQIKRPLEREAKEQPPQLTVPGLLDVTPESSEEAEVTDAVGSLYVLSLECIFAPLT